MSFLFSAIKLLVITYILYLITKFLIRILNKGERDFAIIHARRAVNEARKKQKLVIEPDRFGLEPYTKRELRWIYLKRFLETLMW